MERGNVSGCVHLGRILVAGRQEVHGQYYSWLRELGTSPPSAWKYVALYRFQQRQPVLLARFATLGSERVYALARLPAPGLRRFLAKESEALWKLTPAALKKRTAPYRRQTPSQARAHRAVGLHRRLRALCVRLTRLRAGARLPASLRRALVADLRDVQRAIRKAERALRT
jgi:hypothetical protein